MKRFSIVLAVLSLSVAMMASTASAATLRVKASATQRSATSVEFRSKLSRSATVKVTVYRAGHAVRTLAAKRSGSTYVAKWTGSTVRIGRYTYKVSAKAGSKKGSTSGVVKVAAYTPVVGTTTPAPSPAPVVATTGRWVGLYVPGSPQDMAPLNSAEAMTGVHTAVVNFFIADSEAFPLSRCQNISSHGAVPLVTLEFWSIGSTGLDAITNGSKDSYIRTFATAAKSYGSEVDLRIFHEMNGNWYPWGATVGTNSNTKLIAAWKHVHDIFVAQGATNVKFVFCANNDSVATNAGPNTITSMFPGDAYVDYASLDGYNAGNTQSWSSWRSFSSCFSASYAEITKVSAKPVIIAETSSVESGGSKAQWITDMFNVIPTKFPRIAGVCWFDANQSSDWRIDSSTAAASAFHTSAAKGF
jgi:hypothetical protein